MQEIFNSILFTVGEFEVRLGSLILALLLVMISIVVYRYFSKNWMQSFLESAKENDKKLNSIKRIIVILFILILCVLVIKVLGLDFVLYANERFDLKISHILLTFIIGQITIVLDWFISHGFVHKYYKNRDTNNKLDDQKSYDEDTESSATKLVRYIFYVLAVIVLLKILKIDYTLFDRTINGETFHFKISNILTAVLILFLGRFLAWIFTQLILYNFYRNKKVDVGAQFAINQLMKYVIYLFSIIIALDHLGINMTLLLGGAAALLVGIGLGLQQTFNDFISGLVLLFERSVAVGDYLEFNDEVGIVKKIGMRSSILETRKNVSLIVPNSKLVNDNVTNWTHFTSKVRFELPISIAYGSDTALVKKVLLEIAKENPYIIQYPAPLVRFKDFGDSALGFSLYFFSRNYMIIEDIKSDLRFAIDKAFRENNIQIPFPQREIKIIKE